jgi:sarcosine oxidase subunit alpha
MPGQEWASRLVRFRPVDRSVLLTGGAHFVKPGNAATTQNDEGWMSSVAYSPELGHSIGLGFIDNGSERMGEVVQAIDLIRGRNTEVEIISPHFVDPQGERLRV